MQWRMKWATAPAWTCRTWRATCATASGSRSRFSRADLRSTRRWAWTSIKFPPPFGLQLRSGPVRPCHRRHPLSGLAVPRRGLARAPQRRRQHGGAGRASASAPATSSASARPSSIDGEQFYEASAVLLVFILLGHWLEMRARAGASDAIRALMDLAPPMATVLRDGKEVEVPTAEVAGRRHGRDQARQQDPGRRRQSLEGASAGRRIDAHRRIDAGEEEGRRRGHRRDHQQERHASTTSATKVGADTALAQIVKLVQEAQNSKAPAQLLADRASQWLVLAAIVVGLLTFVVWYWGIGQPLLFALTLTITVFVIACPDALGLATPMAIMVGTGLGAMNGILFKNASALEDATKLDVVIFDKTGTLTMGQPEVVDLVVGSRAPPRSSCWPRPQRSKRDRTIRLRRRSCAGPQT